MPALHFKSVSTVLLLLLFVVPPYDAKVAEILLEDFTAKWYFLSNFAFLTGGNGTVAWTLRSPASPPPGLVIVLYNDDHSSWPVARRLVEANDCAALLRPASIGGPALQQLNLSAAGQITIAPGERPRFYFLALAQADCVSAPMHLHLRVHMFNEGGIWAKEFSADHQGLALMYCIILSFFAVLLIAFILAGCVYRRKTSGPVSPATRALSVILYMEFGGLCMVWYHYLRYMHDGIGTIGLFGLGMVCCTASQLLLVLLLVALSRLTAGAQPAQILRERRLLVCLVPSLLALHAVLLLWAELGSDPTDTTYLYDTPPGVAIAAIRVPVFVYFLYSCFMATTRSPELKNAFVQFAAVGGPWLLVQPVAAVSAAAMEPWLRYRSTQVFEAVTFLAALMGFTFMLRPSRVAALFGAVSVPLRPGGAVDVPVAYNTL